MRVIRSINSKNKIYLGNPNKPEDVIALIGKGVCFDAGGLNIKKTGFIETMYMDKGNYLREIIN